jgi:hypothetical protein
MAAQQSETDSSQSSQCLEAHLHLLLTQSFSYVGNMSESELKEHLLPLHRESSDDDNSELHGPYSRREINHWPKWTGSLILSIIMAVSMCLNCGLAIAYWKARSQMFLCPSEYSKLSSTIQDALLSDYCSGTRFNDKGDILAVNRV